MVYREKEFHLGSVFAKNIKLDVFSHKSMVIRITVLRREKIKKGENKGCCILCSYCKYFMNGYLRAKHQDQNSL